MELLGDGGLRSVRAQVRSGKVQEGRVVDPFGRRRERVADADVDMDMEPGGAQLSAQRHPLTAVLVLLADGAHRHAVGEEPDAVGFDRLVADRGEHAPQGLGGEVAEPEEVEVARGSGGFIQPHFEQQRALQHEPVGVRGSGDAAEEAFHPEPGQERVGVDPLRLALVEQSPADRG